MKPWIVAVLLSACIAAPSRRGEDVVIDLDYTRHQGYFHTNPYGSSFYSFSNVQYASARRFGVPEAPPRNRSIQTGAQQIQCAGSSPLWNNAENEYEAGETPVWENKTLAWTTAPAAGIQDECLFLDMVVPEAILNRKTAKAPVLVYIHGGGYTGGDKNGDNPGVWWPSTDPSFEGQGYMTRSNGSIIFVSVSYRMGIFGFLAGESYAKYAKTNLGIRDQRAALDWVQKYIWKFGGDPDNVTIMGESAGGGSVMHQIIAYGGKKGTPFRRAIPQSPWHQPLTHQTQEEVYQYTLQVANVSTFQELQSLDFDTLYRVNDVVISNQRPFGLFNVGPVVDGDILPAYYNDLLNQGTFEHSTKVMVGHNLDEGYIFASVFIKDETAYLQWLRDVFSNASNETISYISNTLYPPVFDGSKGYVDWHGRMAKTVGDMSAVCNAYLLNGVFNKYNGPSSSYAYEWTLLPGYHAEDIAYTMYAEGFTTGVNETLAVRFQKFIVNFVKTGNPNGPGLPNFPVYESQNFIMSENFNSTGSTQIISDINAKRCQFWADGKYRH